MQGDKSPSIGYSCSDITAICAAPNTPSATMTSTKKSQLEGRPMGGYAELAGCMARNPDWTIFRRFGALGVESLFYLESKLTDLEEKLREVQAENRNSENEACQLVNQSWGSVAGSADMDPEDPRRRQHELIELIVEAKLRYGMLFFADRMNRLCYATAGEPAEYLRSHITIY